MISIQVNNTIVEIQNESNIFDLLNLIKSPQNGIAVAIDDTIQSKENWQKTILKNNDNVLIIQSTQGG